MKTTIDLPDELLVQAKKQAAEERTTLRILFERGLRSQLTRRANRHGKKDRRPIRWITVDGGLPAGVDVSNREAMHDRLRRNR